MANSSARIKVGLVIFPQNGGSLLLYLERAGIDANRRILSLEDQPVRSNLSLPILLARDGHLFEISSFVSLFD